MKKLSLILAMVFCAIGFTVAQRTVTGMVKVAGSTDEPLVGASVLAKGTTTGTVTDIDGKYSLTVPANATTLVFSFAGYQSQEIALGTSNAVDVSLKSSVLDEVVITSTGTGVKTDSRKVPIDVQTIGAKGLPPAPTASIDQALVGKIAGAQISTVNGTPGAKVSILLRGINTINRGTQPMILIDGTEMGATDLNTIDLNTIERVEVVQGATAASIYGAQGANGVIQLFTKKGKNGQINVDFSTSYTNSSFLNIGNLHKAKLHGFNTDASNNVVGGNPAKPLTIDPATGLYSSNLVWNSTDPTVQINKPYDANLKYVDHFKMFLQSAPTANASLAVSGGKDNMDFMIAASTNSQQSNFVGNGAYNRSNLTANIGVEIAKGLKLRSITQLGYTKSTINDGGGNGTIYALFNTRPFADYSAKLPDGTYPAFLGGAQGVNGLNPFFINEYTSTNEQKIDLIQNLNLNYQPTKWLELDAKYGLNYQTQNNNYLYLDQSSNANVGDAQGNTNGGYYKTNFASDATGENDKYQYTTRFTNFLTSATFRFDLSSLIKSSTYAAYDYRNRLDQEYITYGLGVPNYTPYTAAQTADQHIYSDKKTPFVTFGYVVSQHFDIGDFAGVTGGFRSDYSSAFGAGSKAYTFPRGDAYLRVSALDFWKKGSLSNIFPEVKLRGGFGSAGIQPRPFDRYVTLSTVTMGGNNNFYLPDQQSNPNLNVEVSKEIEIGADINVKLLKGDYLSSLTFSPTYWKRSTANAIWPVNYIPSAGFNSIKDNSFSLGSNGFQFSLGLQVIDKKDLSWRMTTNFGHQTSEITKIQGPQVVLTSAAGSTNYVLQEGVKIGQMFGFLGLHDVNATHVVNGQSVSYIADADKGNYEVASNGWVVNKTTKAPYFTPDQYSFGDPNPKFNMSFINGITFKGMVTLNFQFDWVQGSHLYNQTKEWMYRDGIHSDYENPITINGQTGAWSAFYRGVYAERSRNGTKSYFYEDASFVRLRNIELMFDLNKALNIKTMKRLQLVLSGRNLWTKTKYTGMDPEISSGNAYVSSTDPTKNGQSSAWDRGTDHNTMPNLRQYSIGLNVGF